MKNTLILIFISLAFYSCNDAEEVEKANLEVRIKIPNIRVESGAEIILKKQNGDVLFNGVPFSGYLISRFDNDSIYMKKGYLDGKQNGLTTVYYQDGSVKQSRPYLNGEKHGTHIGYHANGQKAFEYYFENGFNEGNHLKWFEDGRKAADMNYVNGKEFGRQQAWRPDGKLRSNYIVRENGRMYGLQGIKRCTKLDGVTKTIDPYKGKEE